MNDRGRLDHLDGLIDRLERLPASPDRDWMIGEVRARKVDVETGVRPGPVRARNDDAPIAPSETAGRRPAVCRGTTPRRGRGPGSGLIGRPMEIHRASPRALAPSRGDLTDAVPDGVAVPAPGAAPSDTHDGRIDLLEQGGILCLGDLPAEAPADAGRPGPRPWARGSGG